MKIRGKLSKGESNGCSAEEIEDTVDVDDIEIAETPEMKDCSDE